MAFFLAMLTEPDRQDRGDDGGQRIRDRADGQRHADPEEHREGLALGQAHHHDGDEREEGRDDDEDGEPVHLLGERGLLHLLPGQHVGDVADLRAHARGGDEDLAVAARHVGVHERHVEAVADADVVPADGRGVLLDRDALAGQGALLDLQRRREDDPAVGGDAVTGVDHHDVAGHDLLGGDLRHRRRRAAPWPSPSSSAPGRPRPLRPCLPGGSPATR